MESWLTSLLSTKAPTNTSAMDAISKIVATTRIGLNIWPVHKPYETTKAHPTHKLKLLEELNAQSVINTLGMRKSKTDPNNESCPDQRDYRSTHIQDCMYS
jgi:hypothetical protein